MHARPSRASAVIIGTAIVIGMALAAVLAPVAATAAGQLVEISSTSGRKADVTRSSQLQVAEAAAHTFVRGWNYASGSCVVVLTAPSTKAVVVKSALVNYAIVDGGSGFVGLHVGTNCSGGFITYVNAIQPGAQDVDFDPGLVIPAGQSLLLHVSDGDTAHVAAFGYKIPPEAAPASATMDGGEVPQPAPAAQ